ncbi:MAG TPA: peptidoglycan DD-metalloendopeptidase family protein [Candidatus Limnocylindrales bacterium]|nr:peptidoglycan DD-metalloendopeptidase family protein [Candidatus Limnocylindrales bacterium]
MASFEREILISCVALFLAVPGPARAAQSNRDLEGIRKKIENEKKSLSQLQVKEGSVLQTLSKIQTDLEKRRKELSLATTKLASLADELRAQESEAERLGDSIAARRDILQKRAAALYRWQKGGSPLMIFNGAVSLGSFLHRRKYLSTAISFDRELLANLQEESQHQEILRERLARKQVELSEQKKTLSLAQASVRQEAEKEKLLLASLRREKTTRLRALREMEAAAQRLEKMMDEIARRAMIKPRQPPPAPSTGVGLEALRGKLDWPVHGSVSAPFGKYKHPEFAGEIFRKGIDIDAPIGEEIRAVEKGTVVYADRFSGYGKMVIVDHGERYYTIYGHLSEIIKKSGDEVRRGEVVGRAGDSDSLAGSKLYFEMRKDGRSLDPVPWFKKQ